MTTLTKTKPATPKAPKRHWINIFADLLQLTVDKINEMAWTVVVLGCLLAGLFRYQPEVTSQYWLLIVATYFLVFAQRVVQAFDTHYTTDELAKEIKKVRDIVDATYRRVKQETPEIEEDDLEKRIAPYFE